MSRARTAGGGIFITGHTEIDRMLSEIIPKEVKKHVRHASRQAAKLVQAEARRRVSRMTGALSASIKVRAIKRQRGRIGAQVIVGKGFFKGDEFYGAFVEFGHRVGRRPGKSSGTDGRSEVKAKPFLRPALYDNEQRVREEFVGALKRALLSIGRVAAQQKLTGQDRRAGRRFLKQQAFIRQLEAGSKRLKPITVFDED